MLRSYSPPQISYPNILIRFELNFVLGSTRKFKFFYVHGNVHLSNTSHINTNEIQLFSLLFGVITLHVSDAVCVHHQEYYKL